MSSLVSFVGRFMKFIDPLASLIFLSFTLVIGIIIFVKRKGVTDVHMAASSVLISVGMSAHLLLWSINYFYTHISYSLFGFSKLIASMAIAGYLVYLFYIWGMVYRSSLFRRFIPFVWVLFIARVILSLFPGNAWFVDILVDTKIEWAIFRNIPLMLLAGILVFLWFDRRKRIKRFRFMWLLILLMMLLFLPFSIASDLNLGLRALMIPAAGMIMLIDLTFLRAALRPEWRIERISEEDRRRIDERRKARENNDL